MNGPLWAAASGVGFGVFQVVNARALRGAGSVYAATFAQLVVATVVFATLVGVEGGAGELRLAPVGSLLLFAGAGMLHFVLGWTTMNQSQARIGAARTAPLLATALLFGVLLGLGATGDVPSPVTLAGIALAVAGAYVVTDPGRGRRAAFRDSWRALGTSAAWALSAVLTAAGLRGFPDPLLGVTVGMAAAAVAYGAVLLVVPGARSGRLDGDAWALKVGAVVTVGSGVALDMRPPGTAAAAAHEWRQRPPAGPCGLSGVERRSIPGRPGTPAGGPSVRGGRAR